MRPIRFEGCNTTYTAPDGMDDCAELPAYQGDGYIISKWEISPEELLRIIFRKSVYLQIAGSIQPPVAITPDSPFRAHPADSQKNYELLKDDLINAFLLVEHHNSDEVIHKLLRQELKKFMEFLQQAHI